MKTLLFVLMPLILLSGCVHKVPAGHVTSYRHTIPVYHNKVHVVKKERTYSTVREKKRYRDRVLYNKNQDVRAKPHSFAMHQRLKAKNSMNGGPKVHPKYQGGQKGPDKGKRKREENKRSSR